MGGRRPSLANKLSPLNKVECPREAFPPATMLVAAVDMLIGTAVLGGLVLVFWFGLLLTATGDI
ncbi:hypothetical protein ACFVVX_32775 [Kitasatospora sp. NPDC058170]|uniref:hypothetical protein n=1 Tax=Kitasatospora sp. NPDC058170 TaxID=3346364 RepID=UPI0036DEB90E